MRITTRKPASVGEILSEEFLAPLEISQKELAEATGMHRNAISRLIHGETSLTAPMAIKLATALGTTPDFWLNIEHACVVWEARNGQVQGAAGARLLPQIQALAQSKHQS